MDRIGRRVVGGGVVAAVVLAGGGFTLAASTDAEAGDSAESDIAITGPELQRARDAALAYTGEGTVTDTEVGDEESYYEVEVTLGGGNQVDVQLDEGFAVVSATRDRGE